MGWDRLFAMALVGALGLLLVSAGIEDARRREIANWKNAAVALLAPAFWWASGMAPWPDMALQLGFAALVFAVMIGVFAIGMMGGGDVKLIAALALWLPAGAFWSMITIMALAGGVVTLLLMIERRFDKREDRLEIPYGVAIAFAAILVLREPVLNHFL